MSDDEKLCLQYLYTTNYETHKNIHNYRTRGTCKWLLRDQTFQTWMQEKTSSLLWLSADPGSGKSTTMAYLADKLNRPKYQSKFPGLGTTVVCHFFFKDDNDQQKTAVQALCAILHQLFTHAPSLVKSAIPELRSKGGRFPEELHTLWGILIRALALANTECSNIICIIDGLDECEELSRNQLIKELVQFYSTENGGTGASRGDCPDARGASLKLIVSSRPYPGIAKLFAPLPSIRVKAEERIEDIGSDIEIVIKDKMQTLSKEEGISTEVHEALVERLVEKADKSFIWTSFVLEHMKDSDLHSKEALLKIIDEIPVSLDAMYEKILSKSSNVDLARKALHLVVSATRPLTLDEMGIAFVIRITDKSYDELRREPNIGKTIRELCGFFIRIIDSKVYLAHTTAREFLVRHRGSNEPISPRGTWKHSLDTVDSHRILASACIAYLLFNDFRKQPDAYCEKEDVAKSTIREGGRLHEGTLRKFHNDHPFFDYAAQNWVSHAQDTTLITAGKTPKRLINMAKNLCDTNDSRFRTWFTDFERNVNTYETSETFTALNPHRMFLAPSGYQSIHLLVAAHLGLVEVVREVLGNGVGPGAVDIEMKDTRFEHRALHIAARRAWGRSVLNRSSSRPYSQVVRLLLERGADANAKDIDGRTPLLCMINERYSSEPASQRLENATDQDFSPQSEDDEIMQMLQ